MLEVEGDVPDPRMCEVFGPGTSTCTAGEEASFSIIARDHFGNRAKRSGEATCPSPLLLLLLLFLTQPPFLFLLLLLLSSPKLLLLPLLPPPLSVSTLPLSLSLIGLDHFKVVLTGGRLMRAKNTLVGKFTSATVEAAVIDNKAGGPAP